MAFIAFEERVRLAFETKQLVAIVGWSKTAHNELTENLSKSGKVVFLVSSVQQLPDNVGFTLFVTGVSPKVVRRLKSQNSYDHLLGVDKVRTLLANCFVCNPVSNKGEPVEIVAPLESAKPTDPFVLRQNLLDALYAHQAAIDATIVEMERKNVLLEQIAVIDRDLVAAATRRQLTLRHVSATQLDVLDHMRALARVERGKNKSQ